MEVRFGKARNKIVGDQDVSKALKFNFFQLSK